MKLFIAVLLSSVFLLLSGLHVYWALGGKWGYAAAIPTRADGVPVMQPGPGACFLVAAGLFACLLPVLAASGLISASGAWTGYAAWLLAVVFLLRATGDFRYTGFFKKIRSTRFAHMDTRYYSPLCVLISLLLAVLQLLR
jgi:hypothetical protein